MIPCSVEVATVELCTTCGVSECKELDFAGRAGNVLEGDGSETRRDDAFGDGDGGCGLFGTGHLALIVRVEAQTDIELSLGRSEAMEENDNERNRLKQR